MTFKAITSKAWQDYSEAGLVAREIARSIKRPLASTLPIDVSSPEKALTGPWDVLTFDFAKGKSFNDHPHITIAVRDNTARIQLTVPNYAPARYWNQLKDREAVLGATAAVSQLIAAQRRQLDRLTWEPNLTWHAHQRRYRNQQDSNPTIDAFLVVDVDTFGVMGPQPYPPKHVPAWMDAFWSAAMGARAEQANLEIAMAARFPNHPQGQCQASTLPNAMLHAAESFAPLLRFLTKT